MSPVGSVFLSDPFFNFLIKDHLQLDVTVEKSRRVSVNDLLGAKLLIFIRIDLLQVDPFGFHNFFSMMIVVVCLLLSSLVMINLLYDLNDDSFVVSISIFTLLIGGQNDSLATVLGLTKLCL